MKRLVFFIIFLICLTTSTFAHIIKKTIQIDNLYKVEQVYNNISKVLTLNLISNNEMPFDQEYAEDCITESLEDFLSDNNFANSEILRVDIDNHYNDGKSTLFTKVFHIIE